MTDRQLLLSVLAVVLVSVAVGFLAACGSFDMGEQG